MATEIATAYVSLVPSARGLSQSIHRELTGPTGRAAGSAGAAAGRTFGSRFRGATRTILKAGALGLAGLAVGATKVLVDAVGAAEESRKVVNQTNAVIKSTGGVANISASGVDKLVTALSLKAGIDDELIASGANVLLTFTKVRDEVGQGNDIFTQATGTALDMSVALGQDMQSSVIQVGKALNDPIKGITALSRVGVSFTQQQKDQIAALVESGDVLGAQKVILGELKTEFGGSAAAQATATERLKVAFGNVSEQIGGVLLPYVDQFATWMSEKGVPLIQDKLVPAIRDLADWIVKHAVPAIRDDWLPALKNIFGVIRDDVMPILSRLGDAFSGMGGRGQTALAGLGLAVRVMPASVAKTGAAFAGLAAKAAAATAKVVAQIAVQVARWAWMGVQSLLSAAKVAAAWLISLGPIGLVIAVVAGAVALIIKYWDDIKRWVTTAARAVVDFLKEHWPQILAILTGPIGIAVMLIIKHWDTIKGAFSAGWEFIAGFFSALSGKIAGFFVGAWDWLFGAGKAVLGGFKNGIQWVWDNVIKGWLKIKDWVVGTLVDAWNWLFGVGKAVLGGFKNGIQWAWDNVIRGWLKVKDWVVGTIVDAWNWLFDVGKAVLGGLKNGIQWVWDNVIRGWLKIKNWVVGLIVKPGLWLYDIGKGVIGGLKNGMKWVVDRIGGFLKTIKDGIVKGFKAVFGIKSPARSMIPLGKNIIRGLIKGLVDSVPGMRNVVNSIGGSLTGFMGKAFRGGAGIVGDIWGALTGGGVGTFGALKNLAGKANVERWRSVALSALAYTGQSSAWVDDLLTQMMHESGGNPRAINLTDSNARKGTPSMGLMQTIGSTFTAHARELAGRGVYDPFANIVAAIRYTVSRYGTLGAWRQRGFKGYKTGGVLPYTGIFAGHRGEVVFTPDQMRVLGRVIGGTGQGTPLYIGNVTVNAGSERDGRRAAKGFIDELHKRAVITDARIA